MTPVSSPSSGTSWPAVKQFHDLLVDQGELRGLVGPREFARLWERHLLNSAAVVPFLPTEGRIIDLGSGAGLPGIVVAAMLPSAEVVLLEPMERRTDWLSEVAEVLGLDNVVVRRGRAQDEHGQLVGDAVTVRAVASLEKLYRWAIPLLNRAGRLSRSRGARRRRRSRRPSTSARKLGAGTASVVDAPTIEGVEVTRVVRVVREAVPGVR